MDSDDWLELDTYKVMIERLEQEEADIAIFGMTRIDEEGKIINRQQLTSEVIDKPEIEKSCLGL